MYQISAPISGNVVRNIQTSTNIININRRYTPTPSNYTAQGKRKATAGDPIRNLSDIQLIKNYYHEHSLRNYLLFILGISTGLRGKDLLRLKVRDVVDCNGYVVKEIASFESKTNKMNHPLLNDEAQAAVSEYLNSLPCCTSETYLFSTTPTSNTPLKPDSLYRILVRTKEALNLDINITVRTLRKTFAYWIIKQHYNDPHVMASLQEMLNHDSMLTTLHYSGHTRENLEAMYRDMGAVINGTAVDNIPKTDAVESKLDAILSALNLDVE